MSAEFQRGLGWCMPIQLVVKILIDDSSGFAEMRWTTFSREAEIMDIVYNLDKDKFRIFTIGMDIN